MDVILFTHSSMDELMAAVNVFASSFCVCACAHTHARVRHKHHTYSSVVAGSQCSTRHTLVFLTLATWAKANTLSNLGVIS